MYVISLIFSSSSFGVSCFRRKALSISSSSISPISSISLGISSRFSLSEFSDAGREIVSDAVFDLFFCFKKRIFGVIGRPNDAENSSIGSFVTSKISFSFWIWIDRKYVTKALWAWYCISGYLTSNADNSPETGCSLFLFAWKISNYNSKVSKQMNLNNHYMSKYSLKNPNQICWATEEKKEEVNIYIHTYIY